MVLEEDTTIEQLYYKYINRAPLYGHKNHEFKLIANGQLLGRNDKTKIKDYFRFSGTDLPKILVNLLGE